MFSPPANYIQPSIDPCGDAKSLVIVKQRFRFSPLEIGGE
jgi:hypothetical protein